MFFRFFSFLAAAFIFLCRLYLNNRFPKSKPDFKTKRAAQKRNRATKKFFSRNTPPQSMRAVCRCPIKQLFSTTTFCRCKTSRKGRKRYEMCSEKSISLSADTLPFFVSNQIGWLAIQQSAERFKVFPSNALLFAQLLDC